MKFVVVAGITLLLAAVPAADEKFFTDWWPAENLGPEVNSTAIDSCASISKDGLSLYFSSIRQNPANIINRDLYVTTRTSVDDPWETPTPLDMLNSATWDSCPALSLDEHRLYFTTRREPNCGNGLEDLWVARRHNRRDDLGWEAPVSLGCASDGYVNSAFRDLAPTFFQDQDGREVMYFATGTPGHHYQTVMRPDGTFGPATPLSDLNDVRGSDLGISVRRDGLEVFFLSNRPGGSGVPGSMDFWTSTRDSLESPWSPPVFVSSLGNPAVAQGRIGLSFDGRELYFTSNRPGTIGLMDIWVARREKLGDTK
jgi:hypothetical protein